jgi:mitochondrial fission protein ELM1
MISECAITQKPIFVAKMKAKRKNTRFEYFLNSFREKGIIRFLGENLDYWSYPILDETNRIAKIIKERLN